MTHHVDGLPRLLAAPQIFYTKTWLGETAAYALEWLNAFAHLPAQARTGLLAHGGTPAQLHLATQQRFSRDVDLLGEARGRIEPVLNAIANRYEGRLFWWDETNIEDAEIDLQRFSAYFANTAGDAVPLKIDVTYFTVHPDTTSVRFAKSGFYVPLNTDDSLETLTPESFIADKLPTLGFDTLGYKRTPDVLGNPEHVWKQMHDISRLVTTAGGLDRVPELYEEAITARNKARGLAHSPDACLADTYRVAMIALAASAYPYSDDRPKDPNYASDVDHVRSGIGSFEQHLIGKSTRYDDASTTALLAAGLHEIRSGGITVGDLEAIFVRLGELGKSFSSSEALRKALAERFNKPANPDGWEAPLPARRLYGQRPSAVMTAWVAGHVLDEVRTLRSVGRFTFEPE